MAQNLHSNSGDQGLAQFVNAAVAAGSVSGLNYPNGAVMQYVKAAIAANTYAVVGSPSLEVAEVVHSALGQ